jgi:hypothetical protein
LTLVLVVAASIGAAGPRGDEEHPSGLLGGDGHSFDWHQWLSDSGPAAVLVWSTWAPESAAVLERLDAIERACGERGLTLVLVDVHEEFEDARTALADQQVLWVHDRHGAVLKKLRVFRVPALVVVDAGGEIRERLEPTVEALLQWEGISE